MLGRWRFRERATKLMLRFAAIGLLSGCTSPLDPKLEAELATVRVSEDAPNNCRYVGESVSFNKSVKGYATADPFDVEGQAAKIHDEEVRLHAKKLGADRVQIVFVKNTELASIVRVNAYYACGGSM